MEAVRDALQRKLKRVGANMTNLIIRVTLVNQYILAALWYLLNLWPRNNKDLEELERLVHKYIWTQSNSTIHKMDALTLYLSRANGGLGALSLSHQVFALATKLTMWALSTGHHPLKRIIQSYIIELSL